LNRPHQVAQLAADVGLPVHDVLQRAEVGVEQFECPVLAVEVSLAGLAVGLQLGEIRLEPGLQRVRALSRDDRVRRRDQRLAQVAGARAMSPPRRLSSAEYAAWFGSTAVAGQLTRLPEAAAGLGHGDGVVADAVEIWSARTAPRSAAAPSARFKREPCGSRGGPFRCRGRARP